MKKKKIGLFILFFLSVLTSINVFAESNYYYYSCDGIANSTEIDLSNEKLYACRDKISNPVNVGNLISYSNTITIAYLVQIYHYYVPADGYYTAYTTGDSDTLIRLYRENHVLQWIDGFIAFEQASDDGSKCDSNNRNSYSIEYLAKGYYYVAVRMYNKTTGSYTINIGPNEDLIYRPRFENYNKWECINNNPSYSSMGIFTNFYQYFTYEQTVLFYRLLNGDIALDSEYCKKYKMNTVTPEGIVDLKENNYSTYVDFVGYLAGCFSSLIGASSVTSITVSSVFYISSLLSNMSNITRSTLINNIKNICGYYTVDLNYDTTKICFKKCLLLKEWYSTKVPVGIFGYNYEVLEYDMDDIYLRGEKYAKGNWKSI